MKHQFTLLFITAISMTFGACVHVDSVRISNQTEDPVLVRTTVDRWFAAFDCNTRAEIGGFNREGLLPIEPGSSVCLDGHQSSRELSYDAREHLLTMTVMRDTERCYAASSDSLMDFYEKERGYQTINIDDDICPKPEPRENNRRPDARRQPVEEESAPAPFAEETEEDSPAAPAPEGAESEVEATP